MFRRFSSGPVAFLLLLAGASAAFGLRAHIIRLAPPLAGLYAALGVPVNSVGLELKGVRSHVLVEGERKVLMVEGEIVNLRRDQNQPPPLALSVRGQNGRDQYAWTVRAPKARLDGGETIAFRARLAAPPDGADVLVRFAAREAPPPEPRREKRADLDVKLRR